MDSTNVQLGMVMNIGEIYEVCGIPCPRCQAPAKWTVDYLRSEDCSPWNRCSDLRYCGGLRGDTNIVSIVICVNGHYLKDCKPDISSLKLYRKFDRHLPVHKFPSYA